MFPKFNERFWDAQLVSDAVNGARSARVEAQIKVHELETGESSVVFLTNWLDGFLRDF